MTMKKHTLHTNLLQHKPLENALYIIPTPIGNLQDITLRGLSTLMNIDILACEDTRTTQKLLDAYQINVKTVPYHDHNGETMRPKIINDLKDGKIIGLVSDAGTPLVSDPGFKLVRDVLAAGHKVIPLPGASAPLTALCGAGLPSDVFTFAGFMPQKSGARQKTLQKFQDYNHTLIFFEGPSRLCDTLADMKSILGQRHVVVARELTKMFEEFKSGDFDSVINYYANHKPKGEIVIIVGPLETTENTYDIDELLKQALEQHRVKDAANMVAEITGRPKKEIYEHALKIKNSI